VFEDGSERGYTDTGTNKDSDLRVKDVFGRRTVGSIDAHMRKGARTVNLDEVSTGGQESIAFLGTFDSLLSHFGDNRGANSKTIAKGTSEISDLTNVDRDVRILRCGGDGKGMPLEFGDFGNLDEQPLSRSVLEAVLENTEFHGTTGMNEHLGQPGGPAGTDLTVNALSKVENARPDDEPPAEISNTVIRFIKGEDVGGRRVNGVTDEAASGVGVKAYHEEEGKMMSVPKGFETLGADLLVSRGVHENHNQQHEVAGDASWLGVMDLLGSLLANLGALDVDEVNVVSGSVDDSPEKHRISDLTMEPDILVGREGPGEFRTNDSDDIAQHGEQDETAVISQNETSSTRRPDGVC
jgi:hypothetical protein